MSKQRKFQPDPELMGGKSGKKKAPQHSLPASKAIAEKAVERLGLERQGVRELAQGLDHGVSTIADEDAEALAQITRSLMPRTLEIFTQKMQANPGEGASIAAMFLEGVAAIPPVSAGLPGYTSSRPLPASDAGGAVQALPSSGS